VKEGLKVKTNSEKVKNIRRTILEVLLPISPTGPIMSLAKKYGVEKSRFTVNAHTASSAVYAFDTVRKSRKKTL